MSAQGTVITRVFTSDAAIPIYGAEVTFSDFRGKVLRVLYTNRSGKTLPFSVDTPPREDSLHPQKAEPFSTIGITVKHPGFGTGAATGVQIFADVETVQPFRLVPLLPNAENPTGTIETVPQDL